MGIWNLLVRGNWSMSSEEKISWDKFYKNLSQQVDELNNIISKSDPVSWDSPDNKVKQSIFTIIFSGVNQISNVLVKFRGKSLDDLSNSNKGIATLYKEIDPYIDKINNLDICRMILKIMSNENKIIKNTHSGWNKKIIQSYKTVLSLFEKLFEKSFVIEPSSLYFNEKLANFISPEKFDPAGSGWILVIIKRISELIPDFSKNVDQRNDVLKKFIEIQGILELFFVLSGKYPSWGKCLIKIRNSGGDGWSQFDKNTANKLIEIINSKKVTNAFTKIKRDFCKSSVDQIKERFKKYFGNTSNGILAKKCIGWFLLSDADRKKSLNDFY